MVELLKKTFIEITKDKKNPWIEKSLTCPKLTQGYHFNIKMDPDNAQYERSRTSAIAQSIDPGTSEVFAKKEECRISFACICGRRKAPFELMEPATAVLCGTKQKTTSIVWAIRILLGEHKWTQHNV